MTRVSLIDIEDIDVVLNHFNKLSPTLPQNSNDRYFDSDRYITKFNEHNNKNQIIINSNTRSMNANGDSFSIFCRL